jgi:hypothetical protein
MSWRVGLVISAFPLPALRFFLVNLSCLLFWRRTPLPLPPHHHRAPDRDACDALPSSPPHRVQRAAWRRSSRPLPWRPAPPCCSGGWRQGGPRGRERRGMACRCAALVGHRRATGESGGFRLRPHLRAQGEDRH